MQFSIHFSANYTTRFSTRNPIVQSSGTSCVGAECSSVYISVQITRQDFQRGIPLCNRQARPAWEQNAVQYTFQCRLHDRLLNAEPHCAIVRHVLRGSRMQFSMHFSAGHMTNISIKATTLILHGLAFANMHIPLHFQAPIWSEQATMPT